MGFSSKLCLSIFPTNSNCMDLKLETYEANICLYTHLMSSKKDISCGSKNPLASNVWNHQHVTSHSTGKSICVAVSLNGHNFKSFIALFRHKLSVFVQNFSFILYIVLHGTDEWGIPLLNFWLHFFFMMHTLQKYCWWTLNTKISDICWQIAVHHNIWLGDCLTFQYWWDDPNIHRITLPVQIHLSIYCGKWLLLCYTHKYNA